MKTLANFSVSDFLALEMLFLRFGNCFPDFSIVSELQAPKGARRFFEGDFCVIFGVPTLRISKISNFFNGKYYFKSMARY